MCHHWFQDKHRKPCRNLLPLSIFGTTPELPPPATPVQLAEIDILSFVNAPVKPPMPTQFGINPLPRRMLDIPLLTPQELGVPQRVAPVRRMEDDHVSKYMKAPEEAKLAHDKRWGVMQKHEENPALCPPQQACQRMQTTFLFLAFVFVSYQACAYDLRRSVMHSIAQWIAVGLKAI